HVVPGAEPLVPAAEDLVDTRDTLRARITGVGHDQHGLATAAPRETLRIEGAEAPSMQHRDDDVVAGAQHPVFSRPDPGNALELVVRNEQPLVRVVPCEVLGLNCELPERPRPEEATPPLRDEEVLPLPQGRYLIDLGVRDHQLP